MKEREGRGGPGDIGFREKNVFNLPNDILFFFYFIKMILFSIFNFPYKYYLIINNNKK